MRCLLFLFISFCYSAVMAQDYTYLHYTNSNGLPSNEVFGIAIDKKGYLWICTDKGISKFDGLHFKNYTSLDGLNDNVFLNITHDYQDRIWLWSFNRQYNYVLDSRIYTYRYNYILDKLRGDAILYTHLTQAVGKNNCMFFSMDEDHFSISEKGEVAYYDNILIGDRHIISVKDGNMVNQGVEEYDLEKLKKDSWIVEKINNKKFVQLYTKKGISYFYSDNEMLIIHGNERIIKIFQNPISSICVDNKDRLWVSVNLEELLLFETLDSQPHHILKNTAGRLVVDQVGNVWFADPFKGLLKFHNSFVEEYVLDDVNILSILIPTNSSLFLDSYNSIQYEYFYENKRLEKIDKSRILPVLSFLEHIRFNQNKIEFYGAMNTVLTIGKDTMIRTKVIQRIPKGYVIGSPHQLYVIDSTHKSAISYPIGNIRMKDLYYVDEEHIFLATIKGIYIWNIVENTHTKINDKRYTNEHTQVIKRIEDYLLFGTKGKGVAVYSLKENKIVAAYNRANSAMPNSINSMYVDKDELWLGSNQGIHIYGFKAGKLYFRHILNLNNGLSSNDILGICKRGGYLYCITENKLNCIDLKNPDLFKVPTPEMPEIASIQINGKSTAHFNSVKTDYNNNDIEVNFNSAYLLDKTRISYYYRLRNFDSKWHITQNNTIRYENIPPGSYQLEFYSSLDNNRLNSPVKTLDIAVTQPYWKTVGFKVMVIIFSIALFFGLLAFYFFQKSKQSKKRMQIVEYQQQALRAQIKPHFIFNALNSIQNFILKSNMESALDFIEKFSTLTRTILYTTENEFSTISEELEIITHYLDIEKIRFRNFDYTIEVSQKINPDNLLVPSLILQPIVENAIWHGFRDKTENNIGHIHITVKIINNELILSVKDDGIGRKAAEKKANHKSIGLSTLKKRLELLKLKNVRIEFIDLHFNEKAIGTQVNVFLSIYNKRK